MDNFLKHLEREIGYTFKNIDLLKQACIRKTYSQENGGPNNEVLEHIGDQALGLAVEKILIDAYSKIEYDGDLKCLKSQMSEAQLTEKKKILVQKTMLAHRIDELSFGRFLLVGNGDDADNISVKEDFFEAIIGAVAIDCEFDMGKLTQVVDSMLSPFDYLEKDDINYVSEIQKWCLLKQGYLPSYEFMEPGSARSRCWYTNIGVKHITSDNCNFVNWPNFNNSRCAFLVMPGVGDYIFVGMGNSNSLARKDAAKFAYEYLEKHNLLWSIKDEISEPTIANAINQLQTLADRGYIFEPKYIQREERDENGNSVWYITCTVEDFCYYEASSSKIKNAKKEAAYNVLIYIMENY